MSDFLLKKGERGLLVGQTGSGKTQNAIFQLRHAPVYPVLVFDTKIEDSFFALPQGDETLDLVQSVDELTRYSKQPPKQWADYILIRPAINEIQDFSALNEYCGLAYHRFGPATVYFDEAYNWHDRGTPPPNLIGLLTRGRSKGKTTLIGTQRPSWISRFCFTEAQKHFIHFLGDERDRKTLDAVIPNFSTLPDPPEFHFWRYKVGSRQIPQLCAPVPLTEVDQSKIFNRRWL